MKITILLGFSLVLLFVSCSKQVTDANGSGTTTVIDASLVPQLARTSFSNDFAGATGIEWQRNGGSSFTVQFNHSSQRHSAGYDDNGHQSSHSIICMDGPVPQAVLDAFRQQFPTDNVYEWKQEVTEPGKPPDAGIGEVRSTFSAMGSLLKFERSI